MAYKRRGRRSRSSGQDRKWVLPSILGVSIIWLIAANIIGKSPIQTIVDGYYWVKGDKPHYPSREYLSEQLKQKDYQIDSLQKALDEEINKSPYRTAIVETTANSLNMRSHPNISSEVVIKIPDSSAVKVLYFDEEVLVLDGVPGKWCKIKYADKEGWVWGNYLNIQG